MIKEHRLSKKRIAIITEAHEWLGTPYHDQQCVKGEGVDCAMFVFGIAMELGMVDELDRLKVPAYSPEWHLHNDDERLLYILESFGCKETKKPLIGDIITFKFGRVSSHLGILCPNDEFIHADLRHAGKVVRHGFGEQWRKRITHYYKFPRGKIDD